MEEIAYSRWPESSKDEKKRSSDYYDHRLVYYIERRSEFQWSLVQQIQIDRS